MVIAMVAASVVILQLITRMLRVDDEERSALMALGWRPRHIAGERAIEGAVPPRSACPSR